MVLAMGVPIDLTQLWLDDLPGWMPYRMHGYFTIVFMLGIGVIAGVASARLTRRLGIADYRRVGVWTGFWAGLGLLPGSVLGYVAGFPINGIRFNMVWSIVIAVLVSALIGGLAFGVLLDRRTPGERSDRSPMLTGRYTGS